MAKPQFKNSKLPIDRAIGQTDQVSFSFWFNIEDPELSNALERYYVLADKKPGGEMQVKVGDQYVRVARFNLFINDERKNEILAGAPVDQNAVGAPPAAPAAPQSTNVPQTAPSAPAAPTAPAAAVPQNYAQAKGGGYGFGS
jgi:hypothetical protein